MRRAPGSLEINFVVTDFRHDLPVRYTGVLPDLFREGQGVVAHGRIGSDGVFVADEVLAKHDENYMPPEVARALKKEAGSAAGGTRTGSLMVPELGHFALILALLLAGLQAAFWHCGRASAPRPAGGRGGTGSRRSVRIRGGSLRVPGMGVPHARFLRALRGGELNSAIADVFNRCGLVGRA